MFEHMEKTLRSTQKVLKPKGIQEKVKANDDLRVCLENRLSEIMGRHRMTQSALAASSGLLPATIHDLYHGRTTSITFVGLARLLHGLNRLTGRDYHAGDLFHLHTEAPHTP